MKTRGHLATHGGLRGHSVGATYPIGVYAQGTPDSMSWVVWNAVTGVIYAKLSTVTKAHEIAEALSA